MRRDWPARRTTLSALLLSHPLVIYRHQCSASDVVLGDFLRGEYSGRRAPSTSTTRPDQHAIVMSSLRASYGRESGTRAGVHTFRESLYLALPTSSPTFDAAHLANVGGCGRVWCTGSAVSALGDTRRSRALRPRAGYAFGLHRRGGTSQSRSTPPAPLCRRFGRACTHLADGVVTVRQWPAARAGRPSRVLNSLQWEKVLPRRPVILRETPRPAHLSSPEPHRRETRADEMISSGPRTSPSPWSLRGVACRG